MTGLDVMVPSAWRVADRWDETGDVFSLALEPVSRSKAPRFLPGQFNMLYAFGVGESAISISGDPDLLEGRLVHTIRSVGSVTSALARLDLGEEIGLRGPFGSPWPLQAMRGKDIVFIGGGIGLAPLRPAILHTLARRSDYGRICILAGVRSPEDALYLSELESWGQLDGVERWITADRAGSDWPHRVGVVTKLISKAQFDPANAAVLVCGPEIMMRYACMELKNRGVAENQVYVTLERNMKCAVAFCGHCQLGPEFICKDGPVFRYDRIAFWMSQREV